MSSGIFLLRGSNALDAGALLVVIITFVLFALSLFLKGFSHDMLLETGVFLVSVKLILMSHKNNLMKESMEIKLNEIHDALIKHDNCDKPSRGQLGGGEIDEWKKLL